MYHPTQGPSHTGTAAVTLALTLGGGKGKILLAEGPAGVVGHMCVCYSHVLSPLAGSFVGVASGAGGEKRHPRGREELQTVLLT